jgi:hypothetical protein
VGIDRAAAALLEARLNLCRNCPGGHATWTNGDLHTCGPMLESARGDGDGTCGCVLRAKARNRREGCPFGGGPGALIRQHACHISWQASLTNNLPSGRFCAGAMVRFDALS